MDLGIGGKRALVTGAGRGLGRIVALGLAAEGALLTVAGRTEDDLAEVVREMGAGEHRYFAADLDTDAGLAHVVGQLTAEPDGVDIVVHNLGGTLGVRDALASAADYERVWRHNLGVAIELNAALIPGMSERGWGRVVHVSSSSGALLDAALPYSVAKAALNAYVRGLGRSVAADGVVVTAVAPGPFVAPGGHWDIMGREHPERVQDLIVRRMPIGRLGTAEEVSDVVVFMCSERVSFCPGAVVPVDGGMM
jgi:NAD(P)-dependent dehydrogenase (short-subunit alcohol dehydrogenase family)